MEQTNTAQEARLHFLDYWRVIKTRKAIVIVVFLLTVLTVATITAFQPRIYFAATRIKVEREEKAVIGVFSNPQFANYDPYFLQTQYEILQSQKILRPVVEQMKLDKAWGQGDIPLPMDLAVRRLKSQLSVRRYRDTSLIEIGVFDTDRQRAADVANMIARVFETERLEVRQELMMKSINKLREELAAQDARVKQAQAKVEELRRELKVPLAGPVRLSDIQLQQLDSMLTQAKAESVSREARLKELRKLTPSQLRNAIATVFNDPNVQSLLQAVTDAELRLEVLKQDFGPDHPTVRSQLTSLEKLREQMDARLDGIIRGFEVEYEMAQARVDVLQKQFDEAKNAAMAMEEERFLPFRNAQRAEESETRLFEALKQRLQQESTDIQMPRSPVEMIDVAEVPLGYVKPNLWLNISIGAVVGIILGVGLAFFIEFLDTSVKKVEEVERYLGLPVLGVVAQEGGLISNGQASGAHIEAYRMLRTNIEFAKGNSALNSLAVLSGGAGEGKSFTTANIACTYAQHGARVLVVDSDMRRPSIHTAFGVNNEVGLAEYLAGKKTVNEIILPTNVANVWMIPAGSASATKGALPMLTSDRMNELIQQAAKTADIVLYDTPPVLAVSDAAVVAREVGTAILVIQHRRYPRNMVKRARQVIENAGGNLLGVVVNNVHTEQDDSYYYYHDHYEHYQRKLETTPAQTAKAAKSTPPDKVEISGEY
jgi:capsular exopolysaccharide synthesis family protein